MKFKTTILSVLLLFAGASSINAQVSAGAKGGMGTQTTRSLISGRVSFKCDLGTYLSMCLNCQQATTGYTGMLHASNNSDQFTQFTSVLLPNGFYAFKTFEGKYMTVCNGCITNSKVTTDFITFHESDANQPWAQFEIKRLDNGKYSVKNVHNGKYMARCNGCSPSASYPNQVGVHAGDAGPEWAQWEIQQLDAAPAVPELSGLVSIRGDLGTFLSMCMNCQQASSDYTAMLHVNSNSEVFARFTISRLKNGYYVFKTYEGKYMAVCSGCVTNSTTTEMIAFHEKDPNQPWAQFEVKQLANGKYSIKSVHNGKYLGRCNGCSPSASYPNQVAAHAGDAGPDWAQWEIIPVK